MIRNGEEILADIDATLDQLIKNAEAVRGISFDTLFENEVAALQKTQESLLAHVIHMDQLMGEEKKKTPQRRKSMRYQEIKQKVAEFTKLNSELIADVTVRFATKPMAIKKIRLHRTPRLASKA